MDLLRLNFAQPQRSASPDPTRQALDDIVRELATWSQQTAQFVMTRAREEMSKRGHQLN